MVNIGIWLISIAGGLFISILTVMLLFSVIDLFKGKELGWEELLRFFILIMLTSGVWGIMLLVMGMAKI